MRKFICFVLAAVLMLTPFTVAAETPQITDLQLNVSMPIYNITDSFLDHYYKLVVEEWSSLVLEFENEIYEFYVYDEEENPIYNGFYTTQSYIELEPGEYIIQITQYTGENSFVVKRSDGITDFNFDYDYLAVTTKDIIDIEYTVLPHEGLVDKIEYIIENTDIMDYDEDTNQFVAKSQGITTLTYNVTDIYGTTFTDKMYIVVAPNVKWNVNRPFAVPQKNDRDATVLEFTVDEAGAYVIYSAGNGDPLGVLYDDEGKIARSDDEQDNDFVINANLEADKSYYLWVKNYQHQVTNVYLVPHDATSDGSFTLDRNDVIVGIGEEVVIYPEFPQDQLTAVATPDEIADVTADPEKVTAIGKTEGKGTITVNNGTENVSVNINVIKPTELTLDNPEDVRINKNYKNKRFSFTPAADGRYVISSFGDYDSYATLYNSQNTVIYADDDSGEGYNFRICIDLSAGETYYLDAKTYFSGTAKFKVVVAQAAPATEIKINPSGYIGCIDNTYYYEDLETFDFDVSFGTSYGALDLEYDVSQEWVTEDKEFILTVKTLNQELSHTVVIKEIQSVFCDVNLDEALTGEDYLLLKSRLDGTGDLVRIQLEKADINSDFTVTQADSDIMFKLLEGIYGHTLTFTADGNTITAKCYVDSAECPVHNQEYSLTLTAQGGEYCDAEYYASVTETLSLIVKNLQYTVYYVGINGTEYEASASAPFDIGEYKAYVTVNGATAFAEFKITQPEKPKYVLGDVSGNNKLDARDYLLLKRAYFGTYPLTETAKLAGDITGNGKIEARDYLLLKRMYFGTYSTEK